MEPAALLSRMVATPSPSGDEGALADFVIAFAGENGLSTQRIGNSVVARIGSPSAQAPRLWLLSHLDTVPVGNGWSHDPLKGEWEGDRLYGRGANDAKVCGASMLAAAAALVPEFSSGRIRGVLEVVLTACEETTNAGMGDVLAALGPPDACICGEPTSLEVVCAQGGLSVLAAKWRGISCHAAHAATVDNVNALLVAARDLAELPSVLHVGHDHPLLGRTSVVTTQLKAGERHNVIPDLAEAVFDARVAPGTSADEIRAELERRLPNAEVTIRSKRLTAVETAIDHPVVRAALLAAKKPRAIASRTLSDMAFLMGVPAVKCGPGDTSRSHTPNEYVTRAELDAGVQFYRAAVPSILAVL